jgi:hypothetical protein
MNCVICLSEETEKQTLASPAVFRCYTCNEGYVCKSCIWKFDECGSIFIDDKKEIEEIIKCPCCRTLNWKYHYNQFVNIILEYDLYDNTPFFEELSDKCSPAVELFLKNYKEAKNIEEDDDEIIYL